MLRLGFAGLLASGACTSSGTTDDAVDTDLPVDTDDSDVPGPPDTAAPDDGSDETDVVETDVVETDTADTGVGCPYVALDDVMAVCDGLPTLVSFLDAGGVPGCPSVWSADGHTGPLDDVLDAASCDRSCVFDPGIAVMALVCAVRGEYITWVPGAAGQVGAGDTCPTWLEIHTVVGSGWTTGSWEDWLAAHPCP